MGAPVVNPNPVEPRGGLARLFAPVDIAWLVYFRIAFGLLMAGEAILYLATGGARERYVEPEFHFTYLGFDWVQPWPGHGMYVHFAVLAAAALGVAFGFAYRFSALLFFFRIHVRLPPRQGVLPEPLLPHLPSQLSHDLPARRPGVFFRHREAA